MQVKVVIGTISFMLAMIILGFATLVEPARLEEATEAFEARQIENGAVEYKNNCATCHGVEGQAETCFDAGGSETGCVGRPLNSAPLLCGEPSQRMTELQWTASKQNLIYHTIASGRLGTLMPVWSQEFGGPMEDHQIEQLTAYIMNWGEDPALCGEEAVVVEQVDWPDSVADLPEGDPDNGAVLYVNPYVCTACHGDPTIEGSNNVGPWLGNISNVAATRIDGVSASEYIYESIVDPSAYIVPECPTGPCLEPSVMAANNFAQRMSLQDMADMVSYMEALSTE